MPSEDLYGGIEAGGTKFNCIVGGGPDSIVDRVRIETTSPRETLQEVVDFFRPFAIEHRIRTLGLGSFGPIDLDPRSHTFGWITSTPKLGWRDTDIVGPLKSGLQLNVIANTDVNAAALGEATWGAARDVDPSLYLTIGTGIGGGFVQDGHPLHGMTHPEMGHIHVPHDIKADPFPGNCPFHGDCFEGLANGPAIAKRFGRPAETLGDEDPFWDVEAGYIAAALATYILVLSPARIILGGGIMQRRLMLPLIRRGMLKMLNGYVQVAPLLKGIEDYVVLPLLGSQSGVLGAVALARQAECGN